MANFLSVNKPFDEKQKEADIARKLQVYGIISGFQQGKLPSNDQIDVALNSFLASKAIANPPEKLSADGKILIEDLCEVIRRAGYLVLSKNSGNLLQNFIWQTRQFDSSSVSAIKSPVGKEQAKQDGDNALQNLRTLGKLIITNGQFRKLLSDATVLLRDMAGDAATNAAGRVRPSEDQLAQMDKPAEDNTWHEAPEFSKAKFKEQVGHVYGGKPKKDTKDVAAAAAGAAGVVDNSITGAAARKKAAQDAERETQECVRKRKEELRHKTREYFSKKVPQERRDRTIWRLKKMVLECQQHRDYSVAVKALLDLAEQYGTHGRGLAKDTGGAAKGARSSFAQAEADLKTLIERFANGTSTDDLWSSLNQIYKDADTDQELRGWFKSMNAYIRRCLLEQGYIMDDASNEEWNGLYSKGRYLLREKYRSSTDRIIHEVKFIAEQFDKDPTNRAFRASLEKLFTDLGRDQTGKAAFKPHLVKDLSEVIIPAALTNISYLPIPRIEYSDDHIDTVVENLVLESDNFMPNLVSIYSENFFKWGRKTETSANKQTFECIVKGIQMDMRNVSYYVRKKKGFLSLRDKGMVDILLHGNGFGFTMRLSTADPRDAQKFFKVEKVVADVSNLKIKFKKSKFKLPLSVIKPIALRMARPVVKIVAEKAIKDQANKLDAFLWEVKQEADAAAQQVYEDPSQAPSMYERYMKAFKNRMAQGKKKEEDVAPGPKKFNMAMTTETSILADVHLPSGVSTKATEFRKLASQGDQWESPVFSIGSAPKSTNIPATPLVQRKPHPMPVADGDGRAPGTGDAGGPGASGPSGTTGTTEAGSSLSRVVGADVEALWSGSTSKDGKGKQQEAE